MCGIGDSHIKFKKKPSSEKQISHIFSHMQNLDLVKCRSVWRKLEEGGEGKEKVIGSEYDQNAHIYMKIV
jgi:hypothetical protein